MTQPLLQKVARIQDTFLGFEDHGIFTCNLSLDYGDGGMQGAGNYSLMDIAGPFITRVLRACGVDCWENLKGRTVYALVEPGLNGLVRGLEPLPTERGTKFLFEEAAAV